MLGRGTNAQVLPVPVSIFFQRQVNWEADARSSEAHMLCSFQLRPLTPFGSRVGLHNDDSLLAEGFPMASFCAEYIYIFGKHEKQGP